jgi:hypothetical protein
MAEQENTPKQKNDTMSCEIFGLSDSHKYYCNYQQQIYFLNIPKNASSFIEKLLRLMVNNTDCKTTFALVRNPYERFISFIMYSGIEKSEKNISMLLEAFATQNQKIIFNILKNEEINFIPQSFYFHNKPVLWEPVEYIWTLESLRYFEQVLTHMGIKINSTDFLPINVSNKDTDMQSFIRNLLENDYSDWFNSFYNNDFKLYNKVRFNEEKLFNNLG